MQRRPAAKPGAVLPPVRVAAPGPNPRFQPRFLLFNAPPTGEARRCSYRLSVLLSLDPIRVFSSVFSPMQPPAAKPGAVLTACPCCAPGPNPRLQPRFFANERRGETRRCSYRLSVLLSLDPIRVFSPVFSPMQRPRRNQALFLPPVRVAAPGPNPRFQPRFRQAALAAKTGGCHGFVL